MTDLLKTRWPRLDAQSQNADPDVDGTDADDSDSSDTGGQDTGDNE